MLQPLYYGTTNNLELYEELQVFVPNSSGNIHAPKLTLSSAKNTLPLIAQLIENEFGPVPITDVETFAESPDVKPLQEELHTLLNQYGSDKASTHDYFRIYAKVLANLKRSSKPSALLEIGLGTNNTDVVSNMGKAGRPGASLRAFRDFLPHTKIYGADVDKRILFSEERIQTGFVDQTSPETFQILANELQWDSLDILIDDGLHSPEANLNTLHFGLKQVKTGGWIIIEDIPVSSIAVWQIIYSLMAKQYQCWLIHSKSAYMFVIKK